MNPREIMLPKIASALGVSIGRLTGLEAASDAGHSPARRTTTATIEEIKRQIAALYGTTPDKVSVSLNL
jgi:hypothetical protein